MGSESAKEPRNPTAYDSVRKASVGAVVSVIGATALWFVATPVTENWLKEWLVNTPIEIPAWKVSLMTFVSSWPKLWPVFVVFVWIISFLPIELVRRVKARRSQAVSRR